ncbi:MAG: STAS domain-containing protein [Gammaproteobacteria bacterium]
MQFEAVEEAGRRRFRFSGRWTVEQAAALEPRLRAAAAGAVDRALLDPAAIEALDLTGAWLLRSFERRLQFAGCRVEWAGGGAGPAPRI